MGSTYMLQHLFNKSPLLNKKENLYPLQCQWLGESLQIISTIAISARCLQVGKVCQRKKWTTHYPCVPSALSPVSHGGGLPIPDAPESLNVTKRMLLMILNNQYHKTLIPPSSEPHLLTQGELNDLVRDLELPKNKAELLGSKLPSVESPCKWC